MPELPDVEGYRRIIANNCLGKFVMSVESVVQPGQKTRTIQMPEVEFAAAVHNRKWIRADRRGKFLIVSLDDGNSIVFHSMLTGEIIFQRPSNGTVPNVRVRFTFNDHRELLFADRRNMGRIFYVVAQDFSALGIFNKLGMDPLSRKFSQAAWRAMTTGDHHPESSIKDLLCDQKVLAGIGNVYSDRILWEARVRPNRIVRSLSNSEIKKVHDEIPAVLRHGIDEVMSGQAKRDDFGRQRHRGGRCPRCGHEVEAIPRGASHSYFCPRCQK